MDGRTSELLHGNARGSVQSSVLSSSPENDSAILKSPPLSTKGYAVSTQDDVHKNEVKDVRSVVQPSDINQKALQESSTPDHQKRELWPINGPGKDNESQNVAIENHNDFHRIVKVVQVARVISQSAI